MIKKVKLVILSKIVKTIKLVKNLIIKKIFHIKYTNYYIGIEEMIRDEELLNELNEAQIRNKERLEKENQDNNDNEKNKDFLYRFKYKRYITWRIKENVVIPNYEKYNELKNYKF